MAFNWVPLLIGASTYKGASDARQAKKREKEHGEFRKAAIRHSPWTGMGDPGAQNFGNTDMLAGAIGGGLQGAAIASMLGGGMGGKKPSTPASIPTDGQDFSPFGGSTMAAQLGSQGAATLGEASKVAAMPQQPIDTGLFAGAPMSKALIAPQKQQNTWGMFTAQNSPGPGYLGVNYDY